MPRIDKLSEGQLSMIFPTTEEPTDNSGDVNALVEIALAAASNAVKLDLSDVADRMQNEPRWPNIWPGEHYKLLTGLTAHIRPTTVVEVGTFLGLSALAIKKSLPAGGRIVTFDVLSWDSFPVTCLRQSDFADGRLKQVLGNLADPIVFMEHTELLAQAELIFLDGPKNRIFERAFLLQLATVKFAKPSLLVIDDIRLWNMLDIWREIPFSKLDVTSLGHFSGTGLVRLKPK
jgi:predicted O-methyltransferase YrrM